MFGSATLPTLAARVDVFRSGAWTYTTCQAVLWRGPTYKIEEDWRQMLAQSQSSSLKKKERKKRFLDQGVEELAFHQMVEISSNTK